MDELYEYALTNMLWVAGAFLAVCLAMIVVATSPRHKLRRARRARRAKPYHMRYRHRMIALAVVMPVLLLNGAFGASIELGGDNYAACAPSRTALCEAEKSWVWTWVFFTMFYALSGAIIIAPLLVRLGGRRARALSGRVGRRGVRGWLRHVIFWTVFVPLPVASVALLALGSLGLALLPTILAHGVRWLADRLANRAAISIPARRTVPP